MVNTNNNTWNTNVHISKTWLISSKLIKSHELRKYQHVIFHNINQHKQPTSFSNRVLDYTLSGGEPVGRASLSFKPLPIQLPTSYFPLCLTKLNVQSEHGRKSILKEPHKTNSMWIFESTGYKATLMMIMLRISATSIFAYFGLSLGPVWYPQPIGLLNLRDALALDSLLQTPPFVNCRGHNNNRHIDLPVTMMIPCKAIVHEKKNGSLKTTLIPTKTHWSE